MSKVNFKVNGGPVQSSGLSTVTVASVVPGDPNDNNIGDAGMIVYAYLIGKDSSNNIVAFTLQSTFRLQSGTLTQRGGTNIMSATGDTSLLVIVPSFDASSNAIRLRVGGIALSTIDWTGWIEGYTTDF